MDLFSLEDPAVRLINKIGARVPNLHRLRELFPKETEVDDGLRFFIVVCVGFKR